MAERNDALMAANETDMGISRASHLGRRANGNRRTPANTARQNPIRIPRESAGQLSKTLPFTKRPLVLHSRTAPSIKNRPLHRDLPPASLSLHSLVIACFPKNKLLAARGYCHFRTIHARLEVAKRSQNGDSGEA